MIVGVYDAAAGDSDWFAALDSRREGGQLRVDRVVQVTAEPSSDDLAIDILVVGGPKASELRRFGNARFIQSTWAGPDVLANDPDRPAVPIARTTGGGLGTTMAEYVLATVLAAHRQFPHYERANREAVWSRRSQVVASERTVGLLGYGALSSAAAELLVAVGFNVIAWVRSEREASVELVVGKSGFDELLQRSDMIVNLLPLTDQTTDLLNAKAFARCRPGACLINAGRGGTVVDPDLVAALDAGLLEHAWLDAFDAEPLPADHPFWTHDRITVTPHIAAESSVALVADQLVDNINRFVAGDEPHFLI